MVLGILAATVAVPSVVGTTEAIRQGQQQNAREEHRGRKSELVVSLPTSSRASFRRRHELGGALVVLWRNKLWIRTNTIPSKSSQQESSLEDAHPFTGYFLEHPDQQKWRAAGHASGGEGLVTTITLDPPMLNWVYVHPTTHELKYGTKAQAEADNGICGPWDVTKGVGTDKGTGLLGGGRRLTFDGWEGFVAVEEPVAHVGNAGNGANEGAWSRPMAMYPSKRAKTEAPEDGENDEEELWALYFDIEDDGLSTGNRMGTIPDKYNILEVELTRTELRRTKEAAEEERRDRLNQSKKVDAKLQLRKDTLNKPKDYM